MGNRVKTEMRWERNRVPRASRPAAPTPAGSHLAPWVDAAVLAAPVLRAVTGRG